MQASEMKTFNSYLREHGIIFCYSGYMTEEVLVGVGNAIKTKLAIEDVERQKVKRVFSIFVEAVQNVIRYSAHYEEGELDDGPAELRYGVLTVGEQEGHHFVACGNLIRNEDVARLEKSLEHIRTLDPDGLKTLYKETLRGEAPEGSKGAGVGFIEIARRATHGFQFSFADADDDSKYFSMQAFV